MRDTVNICWPGWETVKMIGRGSFGCVYEIQRSVGNWVEKAALKIISIPQNNSDIEEMYSDGYNEESITSTFQSYLQSILEEYSLMKKMSGCRNVVHCDDVRYIPHEDGIGWDVLIKMELLTPVTKFLPNNIDEQMVIQLAKDICKALEECKKYNVIHRDIKPQNIFVSENGDYKLGDFGIAKTVEKTMGGTKIGTYKYMAPEVYKSEPYGSAADIYSLGLVLYWMLNDRRMPFMPLDSYKMTVGMEEEARQRRLSGERIPAPAHGREGLKKIVLKACSYNPTERYKSASEMRNALENLSSVNVGGNSSDVNMEGKNSECYDVYTTVWVSEEEATKGCTRNVQINETGKTLCADIPAGIKEGQKIRLQGCGKLNPMTGTRGNVFLTVRISKENQESYIVYTEMYVTKKEAYEGCYKNIVIQESGKRVLIHVPEGVKEGHTVRLREFGKLNPYTNTRGDAIVIIKLKDDASMDNTKKVKKVRRSKVSASLIAQIIMFILGIVMIAIIPPYGIIWSLILEY